MLIDTHAHLNDPALLPLAEEIAAARADRGPDVIVNVGYDVPSSFTAVELARRYAGFYAVVGIHPHDSKSATAEDYRALSELASDPKVRAYGEIGLDYHYDLSERETQRRVFAEQLELADSLRLPVVLHIREAHGDALKILKENRRYVNRGGIVHCYSGSKELIREYLAYDFCFSFGGAVTFKNFGKADVVLAVPRDKLLIETDCPYMTPVPYRGKTNLPEYIRFVRDKIQEWMPDADVEMLTANNAKMIYGI